MADISGSIAIGASKNNVTVSVSVAVSKTMSGSVVYENVQTVGFSTNEALELGGDIGTPLGILFLKNLDATNFFEISLGSDMTKKFAKLLAGESVLLMGVSSTLRVQADTGDVQVQVIATSA